MVRRPVLRTREIIAYKNGHRDARQAAAGLAAEADKLPRENKISITKPFYRYTNDLVLGLELRQAGESGTVQAFDRAEALVLAQAEVIAKGGRWRSVKIAPPEESLKPENGMKMSERKKEELYGAISGAVNLTRLELFYIRGEPHHDSELLKLQRRIWREVHKVLNLEGPP
jgi:hypothetical protein